MKNAPLVEIIAEVRWGAGRTAQPPSFIFGSNDPTYVRLGVKLAPSGYERLERVQPEGMPFQAGSIVYRYRRGDEQQNTLFQAGQGIFTANGLPPYDSWDEFSPVIELGIQALLDADAIPADAPAELVLRYVDAFDDSHLNGISAAAFIEQVMGISYAPTRAASEFGGGTEVKEIRFHATHVSPSGERVIMDVGNGTKDGHPATVLNTAAISAEFRVDGVEAMMARFAVLQDVLHDMFFQMMDRSDKSDRAEEARS